MKINKLVKPVFLLLAAVAAFYACDADAAVIRRRVPLVWRTQELSTAGFRDSTYFQHAASQQWDTTATIPIAGLRFFGGGPTELPLDSCLALTTVIYKATFSGTTGFNTAAGDSVYLCMQGSFDGSTWFTFAGVNQNSIEGAGTAGTLVGQAELGTSEVYWRQYRSSCGGEGAVGLLTGIGQPGATLVSGSTPAVAHFMLVPNIRFIVQTDATGPYQGYIDGWWEDSQVPGF